MKTHLIFLLFFITVSCHKEECVPYGTCNDETLEFGCKKDICKTSGLKFYYPCKPKKNVIVKNQDC